jgi:pimeloyl-ACP methyl ester carboxylesterase
VERQPFFQRSRPAILAGFAVAVLSAPAGVMAQALKDVNTPDKPLVLKAQGSFFVGGEKIEQTAGELGDLGPGGHITVNQMYVHYMVPQGGDRNIPVVMVHGATLTGKSWETTPDGRMGWDEYFVRKGHPIYVPDQVGRGRSGFNQAVLNNVRAGSKSPSDLPVWLRFSDEGVWPNFRFGATAGQPFSDSQFPVTSVDELSKQAMPDMFRGTTSTSTIKALSELAAQLNGAVVMGHSQSGVFPLEAALLNPKAMKGPGYRAYSGRIRRSPRQSDGSAHVADMAGPLRDVSGPGRPHQERWRSSRNARAARPGHSRQQPHDHAGQEQPADRRSDSEVDRRARPHAERRGESTTRTDPNISNARTCPRRTRQAVVVPYRPQ